MPRLEAYEQQVTAQPVQGGSVPIESFTGGWKTATETFKTLDDTVQQFKKVRDFNETSAAELNLRADIDAIEQESFNDSDPNNAENYRAKIDESIARNASRISDPLIRRDAAASFNLSGYSSFARITNDFRKKSIDIGRASYMERSHASAVAYANATDANEKKAAEVAWINAITDAKEAGIFSETDLVKLKIAHENEVRAAEKDAAIRAVHLDPQTGRDLINRGDWALSPEDKHKIIEDSFRIEKAIESRTEYEKKQVQKQSLFRLSDMLMNRSLTPQMVREMETNEEIGSAEAAIFYAAALKTNYPIPPGTQLAKPDYFLRLLDDAGGEKDLQKSVLVDAAKAYAENKLGENQYRFFIQEANNTFNQQSKGSFINRLGGVISSIKSAFASFLTDSQKTQVIEDMTAGFVEKGIDDNNVVNQVTLEALAKQNSDYRQFLGKKPGDIVTLSNGVMVRFNGISDGDIDVEVLK